MPLEERQLRRAARRSTQPGQPGSAARGGSAERDHARWRRRRAAGPAARRVGELASDEPERGAQPERVGEHPQRRRPRRPRRPPARPPAPPRRRPRRRPARRRQAVGHQHRLVVLDQHGGEPPARRPAAPAGPRRRAYPVPAGTTTTTGSPSAGTSPSGTGRPAPNPRPPAVADPAATTRSRPVSGASSGSDAGRGEHRAQRRGHRAASTRTPCCRSSRRTSATAPARLSGEPLARRVGARPAPTTSTRPPSTRASTHLGGGVADVDPGDERPSRQQAAPGVDRRRLADQGRAQRRRVRRRAWPPGPRARRRSSGAGRSASYIAITSSSGTSASSAARRKFAASWGLACRSATSACCSSVSGWMRTSSASSSSRASRSRVSSAESRPENAPGHRGHLDVLVAERPVDAGPLERDQRDDAGVVPRLDRLVGVGVPRRHRRRALRVAAGVAAEQPVEGRGDDRRHAVELEVRQRRQVAAVDQRGALALQADPDPRAGQPGRGQPDHARGRGCR